MTIWVILVDIIASLMILGFFGLVLYIFVCLMVLVRKDRKLAKRVSALLMSEDISFENRNYILKIYNRTIIACRLRDRIPVWEFLLKEFKVKK